MGALGFDWCIMPVYNVKTESETFLVFVPTVLTLSNSDQQQLFFLKNIDLCKDDTGVQEREIFLQLGTLHNLGIKLFAERDISGAGRGGGVN